MAVLNLLPDLASTQGLSNLPLLGNGQVEAWNVALDVHASAVAITFYKSRWQC